MATGVKPQAEDVLLTVSVQHPSPEFQFPERRVILEQKHPSVVNIGRTSKRFSNLEAKADNCFFDSPVMSREHAKITIDWYHKRLFIKDIGSLHGTYHNSLKLPPHSAKEMKTGDILKFGIDIQRSNDLFPPCTIQVDWEFDHLAKEKVAGLSGRPTFSVPDDSDSESSDEDMSTTDDIRATVEKIRKIEMPKSTMGLGGSFPSLLPQVSIDLTVDEDIQKDTDKPPERAPNATQEPEVTIELDAPHDEEDKEDEDVPSCRGNSKLPLLFASESESEDSYDNDESESYPDDEPSSQEMLDPYDDEICLSDSEESDRSDDVEAENSFESESEDENLVEAPSYDEAATWEVQDPSLTFTQSQQMLSIPHTNYFPQPDTGRQFFPAPMPSLPSIIPYEGLQEQGRQNDLRLPAILNPSDDQVENPFLASMNPEQMHASAPTYHLLQSEGVAPLRASWERVSETPKGVTVTESLALAQDDVSAEALGQASGKPEFFAAREANKQILRRQEQNSTTPVQPRSQVPEPPATSTEPSTSKLGHHTTSDAAPAPEPEPVNETPKSAKVAESAWSSSGERFLNSPQDFPITHTTETPELDMTSAYQFQQSKLGSLNAPTGQRTTLKRKASEIATLTPHEETFEAAVKSDATGARTTAVEPTIVSVVTEPTPEAPPAPKRLRSFLSKAGYFVGGGVLTAAGVVTALAATAPAL
ncbi:hypothetical protein COL5a_009109 [Colletotrichum fioriniae]|nr:uncharacterized protein COL516b_012236 [Colletotrichum fioriniae]KAJ0295818.1 hypothetical protein COL516b_012236 [Colletotrichum fioriniae]KAJ0321925.1 hypothetical protein COL5a_009109 [Colletotrichum fioriniae]